MKYPTKIQLKEMSDVKLLFLKNSYDNKLSSLAWKELCYRQGIPFKLAVWKEFVEDVIREREKIYANL